MEKEFIPVDCNNIACTFFNKCCKCATEIVRTRENDPTIDIMFIGQGAGAEEDQVGKPFQGRAGKLLRSKVKPFLQGNRLNIILDNTIRARPLDENGKNRPPTDAELKFCIDFVWQRIDIYRPSVIIPLGYSATSSMLPNLKGSTITAIRGKSYSRNGHTFFPTFHPAAILHAGENERKISLEQTMVSDIQTMVRLVIPSSSNLL